MEEFKEIMEEFIPENFGVKDCSDQQTWGQKSIRYDYIVKSITGDIDYPILACPPWVHGNFQVDNVQLNQVLSGTGNINIAGNTVTADVQTSYVPSLNTKAAYWDAKKPFDIPHPTKENHRLRYVCLEGPQAEVYLRGKLINQSVIELPDYWRELVDAETIGVTLTPVGSYQELYVEKVEWGTHITIKNSAGGAINCTYVVYGERKDTSRNIPEYEGTSPKDYPGDNREYSINSGNKTWT